MASTVARMCGGHRRTCERLKFFAVLTLKKKVTKLTKEIRSWPQGIRTGYKITELPIEPQGSWRVKLIKKAIRLWYVSFFVLCCRCAFFAMSMFERASLLLFSVLTREFVLFQEIVLLYMATFREGWFAGRRHSQTLLLKPKSARMSVNSLLLHLNSVEQRQTDENLNVLQLSALGIIGFYTSHTTLGLRPRVVCSVCKTR